MERSPGTAHLRGLVLGTLFPGFSGTTGPPDWLAGLIRDGLGGVVLFGRNVDPGRGDDGVAALTARLRAERPDLLVAIDEEGGDVTRLDATTGSDLPGSAALGTVDPQNPIVGVRAFGADPHLVARHVQAFVEGQQLWRVAATAKHFPGHGATDEDSHLTTPTVSTPADVLTERELVPFRAAISSGVQIVMTAHITVPALDPSRPATLSRAVITGLLRERLGFGGVVMTDGLDMQAISGTVGQAEGAVLALDAGVDALCVGGGSTGPQMVETIVAAVVGAVESGRLGYERLAEAADRVRRLSRWVDGTPVDRSADGGGTAGARAAQRAVVAVGDVTLDAPPVVLELQDEPSIAAGHVPWGVGAPLADRLPGTVVVPVTESGPDPVAVLADHPDRPVIVAVRGVRRRAWQADVVAAVRALRPDLIVVDHELPADP